MHHEYIEKNMPEEMRMLREGLIKMGIPYEDDTNFCGEMTIYKTYFTHNGNECSVICGKTTDGGIKGYLETTINNHDPIGWMSAKAIILGIERGII